MPAALDKKRARIKPLRAPAIAITWLTFNDKTGRTQGIKFKINPPINAMSQNGKAV